MCMGGIARCLEEEFYEMGACKIGGLGFCRRCRKGLRGLEGRMIDRERGLVWSCDGYWIGIGYRELMEVDGDVEGNKDLW